MRKRFIPSLLLGLLLAGNAHAAAVSDSLRATVYYRTAKSRLELPFMGNAANLKGLVDGIRSMESDSACKVRRINILSSASPEGNSEFNKTLSARRGEELRDYLKDSLSFPDSIFSLRSVGEDWGGLAGLVEKTDAPWRDRALSIIRRTPEWIVRDGQVVDGRKRQLMNLDGGRAWKYMNEHFFDSLRSSALVVCEVERLKPAVRPSDETASRLEPATEEKANPADGAQDALSGQGEPAETDRQTAGNGADTEAGNAKRPFYMAAKTNLLYDAAMVPNVGLEFSLGKGWSVGGNWMYAWWRKDSKHRYWRVYGGELDVRKYFGRKASEKPLQGHHVGVYAGGLTYDFETGGKGYLSHFSYVVGAEYGYSLPLAKRLNMDFGLGIGYAGGKYKTYEPEDGHYVYKETKKRRWFGPTKAEVSLVWLLGRGNVNTKKGGSK